MRKILFRGKRTDNKGWAFGSPVDDGRYVEMCNFNYDTFGMEHYLVAPETVGQYTGMFDKNANRIFEGDIVKLDLIDGSEIGIIIWCDKDFRFKIYGDDGVGYGFDEECMFEIIGNAYDNPELLIVNKLFTEY